MPVFLKPLAKLLLQLIQDDTEEVAILSYQFFMDLYNMRPEALVEEFSQLLSYLLKHTLELPEMIRGLYANIPKTTSTSKSVFYKYI